MPRIKQYAHEYAVKDFQTEIRTQQGIHNLMSVRALAGVAGIPHNTLGPKLKEPDKLDVVDLRKLVEAIAPDPAVILALIGYDKKTINRCLSQYQNVSA